MAVDDHKYHNLPEGLPHIFPRIDSRTSLWLADYCKAQASTSQGPAVVDQAFSLSPDAQSPEPDYEYGVYDEWGDDPVEITVSAPVDIAALGICTRNMIKLLDNLNSSETPISLFMDALHSTGVAGDVSAFRTHLADVCA